MIDDPFAVGRLIERIANLLKRATSDVETSLQGLADEIFPSLDRAELVRSDEFIGDPGFSDRQGAAD